MDKQTNVNENTALADVIMVVALSSVSFICREILSHPTTYIPYLKGGPQVHTELQAVPLLQPISRIFNLIGDPRFHWNCIGDKSYEN